MTPQEAQAHAQAIGYPWLAMDADGEWRAHRETPTQNPVRAWWDSNNRSMSVFAPITYKGDWKDSLTPPTNDATLCR